MCDTGALHLPSFLDKTIMYGYLKAEWKDEDENVIHYRNSTFSYLLRNVFSFVKIPKVNQFTRCDCCMALGEEKRKAQDEDPKGYFDVFQFPHDANFTINMLLLELQSMGEDLTDTFCLQMDKCWRENKNQFVLNFLALLAKLDILLRYVVLLIRK
ncbi:hypothetical protein pdam_00020590 [Pocillopora damicornis]|uniref:DUF7869 domain-containing protein n=1 Tax=Pocillopora damicornis TaxID=46731 RepID=A0A3M6UUD5_POCDA|nr:hypothetical protein pdam_00020590 [Pocillopora damicornis]